MVNATSTVTNTTSTSTTAAITAPAVDTHAIGNAMLDLFLPALLWIALGIGVFAFYKLVLARGHKRGGSIVLGSGILPVIGLVLLVVAVLSFILGLAAGSYLFSGFAINVPGGSSLVFQPWQVALFFAFIALLLLGLGRKRRGRR